MAVLNPAHSNIRPQSRLTVSIDLAVGRITLAGTLDRRTTRYLLDAVRTLRVVHQARWVIDAEALTAYDDAGLRALGACYRAALRQGAQMTVVGPSSRLRAALNRLRLDQHVIAPALESQELPRRNERTYPLVKISA